MRNVLLKSVLPTTIAIFCALIGFNAYLASNNLKVIETHAAQRIDTSEVQAGIVAVEVDLQALETGQRGYLLTGDASYLAPYTQAVETLPQHFSTLRSRIASRPAEERGIEREIEAVAESKIADANDTIRLRQKGYRHRAFLIVDSNRGKELMDKARSLLERLSAVENSNVAQYDRELRDSVRTARQQSMFANFGLLALTVVTLIAFHRRTRGLAAAYARQTEELRSTRVQLDRFTSTMSGSVRTVAMQMRTSAESLLNRYGGFLPRQGQERAEWIHDGSCEINRLLDDLLGQPSSQSTPEDSDQGALDGFYGRAPHPLEAPDAQEQPRSQTA